VDLLSSWIDAGLPINALGKTKLKDFLEKHCKRPIPSVSSLSSTYLNEIFSSKMVKLKSVLSNFSSIYLQFDETECHGSKVNALLIGGLDGCHHHEPYLAQIDVSDAAPNAQNVQQFILSALADLGLMNDYNKVKVLLTDGASYNVAAGKQMKHLFPSMLHIICVAHLFHRIAQKIMDEYPDVNSLLTNIKRVFEKSKRRKSEWKSRSPNKNDFPIPSKIRWCTWIESCVYVAKFYSHLKQYLSTISSKESRAASDAAVSMDQPSLRQNVHQNVSYISSLDIII